MKNIIVIASVIVVALGAWWLMTASDKDEIVAAPADQRASVTKASETDIATISHNGEQPDETTRVTEVWEWQKRSADSVAKADEVLFTEQSVHDALQAVRLDGNGNVVLDQDAKIALDEALERIYKRLDAQSLQDLQDIIQQALPEPAAQQTAQLVADYNNFLQAKDQFTQMYSDTPSASEVATPAAVDQDRALYAELQSLRELHLGENTARELFAVDDASAQFMFDTMRLNFDSSLSAEERASQLQTVQAQYQQTMSALTPEDG